MKIITANTLAAKKLKVEESSSVNFWELQWKCQKCNIALLDIHTQNAPPMPLINMKLFAKLITGTICKVFAAYYSMLRSFMAFIYLFQKNLLPSPGATWTEAKIQNANKYLLVRGSRIWNIINYVNVWNISSESCNYNRDRREMRHRTGWRCVNLQLGTLRIYVLLILYKLHHRSSS